MTYWMDQRRSNKRYPTRLGGRIIFGEPGSSVTCLVRDVSDSGARLAVIEPVDIPPVFELRIPARRLAAQVRVMWVHEGEYGVMFTGRVPETPIALPEEPVEEPEVEQDRAMSDVSQVIVDEILGEARAQIAEALKIPPGAVALSLRIAAKAER
jgi:hypothetical protein